MEIYDIVKKLVGNINPIGKTEIDEKRFENLKILCHLVNQLVIDIDNVSYENRKAQEFSIKRASDYASNFLRKEIGISE